MKSSGLTVLSLFLAVSASGAASLASVEFLGFSIDGKYAAKEQYWIEDGSGFPRAEITVMSVADNNVIRVFEVHWTEELMYENGTEMYYENSMNPARETVLGNAESCLDSLGISSVYEGVHCVSHPLTDTGADPENVQFVTWVGSSIWMGPEFSLNLQNHSEKPDSPPDWLSMFETPVLLEVLITDAGGTEVMHLLDHSYHPEYRYVSNYRIRDVYVYDDSLTAIILNTTEPGFEGPDSMFRMVTGVISH
ncbi:MAG: DUF2259 domain-containing protein [Candidatus Aegiribacteria sp.]|nr:DUF2259 domain-containing protein [Candidatus Aegiribacteria sp.]